MGERVGVEAAERPVSRLVVRFFGRTMFFGIGGLMVSPLTIGLDALAHANLTWPLVWAGFCVAWTLAGMIARTIRV